MTLNSDAGQAETDLQKWRERIEIVLAAALPSENTAPVRLHQAMRYATLGAGKRIRACLVYASGSLFNACEDALDGPAAAVEMTHAYSLIHDDLPAMDNDDVRRGKPTLHIAFDEVCNKANARGIRVTGSELVGLIPLKAMTDAGKYFLQNSGSHTLMKLSLSYSTYRGEERLEEKPNAATLLSTIIQGFGMLGQQDQPATIAQYVYIKKVADQPDEMLELMKDCIARDKKITDTVVKIIAPPKPKDSVRAIVKITLPEKPKEILPPVVLAPVEFKKDSVTIPKTLSQRKNKEQSFITVNTKSINLKVYDNAIMDGDTVSILYNGKMLLTHQLLSEKGIEINLELDEKQTRHELVLFAENLGSIPPNTALIVITAGGKRYELFASASLEENAVLVFEYKPK